MSVLGFLYKSLNFFLRADLTLCGAENAICAFKQVNA